MTSQQRHLPFPDDPLGLNRRLQRALSNRAIPEDVVDVEKLDSVACDALFRVAEALGECRLFDVEIEGSLDGTLPLGVAVVVVEQATREAAAIKKALERLAGVPESVPIHTLEQEADQQEADQIEDSEEAIQLVERRLALVAVREATEEAYYAAEVDSELLQRLERRLQEDLDANEALDKAMVRNMRCLLPVRRTNLLENWQTLLRERYRLMAQHWWFFDEALWHNAETQVASEPAIAANKTPAADPGLSPIEKIKKTGAAVRQNVAEWLAQWAQGARLVVVPGALFGMNSRGSLPVAPPPQSAELELQGGGTLRGTIYHDSEGRLTVLFTSAVPWLAGKDVVLEAFDEHERRVVQQVRVKLTADEHGVSRGTIRLSGMLNLAHRHEIVFAPDVLR